MPAVQIYIYIYIIYILYICIYIIYIYIYIIYILFLLFLSYRLRLKCPGENYLGGLPKEMTPYLIPARNQWPKPKRRVFLVRLAAVRGIICPAVL